MDMITKEPQATNITSRRPCRKTTSLVKDRSLLIALLLTEVVPIQMLSAGERKNHKGVFRAGKDCEGRLQVCSDLFQDAGLCTV